MDHENYIELVIEAAYELNDVLIAELAELGYEGFEEADGKLKAYLPEGQEGGDGLNILLSKYQFTYLKSIIKKQNWNAVWESNFEPVQVDDFVGVRAFFHPPFEGVAHEIVITPKMSFGT
ncbi:MAG: hypothetical protein JWQ78_964, partial [Sediminibacterium sp.]|nr:hypothetical protein [Sediminibacterium sp.]